MASSPITSWQIDGETMERVTDFIFLGSKITGDDDCSHEIKRCLLLGRKAMAKLDSILQSRDITLPTNLLLVKMMVFPVAMYGCECWTIKKAEHQRIDALVTVVLKKSLESSFYCKILPVNPKGNQSWVFIGSTDISAEVTILWPGDVKNWLIGKDLDAGNDWRQKEKGTTEDEMIGWLHWIDGHEFESTPGVGDGEGRLVYCSPWGCHELDTTVWSELNLINGDNKYELKVISITIIVTVLGNPAMC